MRLVLANLLLDHPAYAALVEGRCYWDELPQSMPVPATVMHVVGGITDYVMSGASGYAMTRVQFDNRGETADRAREVAEAMVARLSGFRGTFEQFKFQGCFEQSQRTASDKDGAVAWFTNSRDFTIHWAPA